MRIILPLIAIAITTAIAFGTTPVEEKYVEYDPPKNAITVETAGLYDAPDDGEEAVKSLAEDTELQIVAKVGPPVEIEGKESSWYKVDLGDGEDYYVIGAYLKFEMHGYIEK